MTSYWVLLNQGALKVKAGSYLPTKEPGDCQVSLCHQLPSTGLFSAWVEPLEGFNWASNLWHPWSLGTSSGGPWEKNVPSPSDSNRRVGKKTANGGMVRTQEQWKRRCKHQHIQKRRTKATIWPQTMGCMCVSIHKYIICIYLYIYIHYIILYHIILMFFCSGTSIWSHRRASFRCSTRLFGPVARCESSPALLPHPISTGGVCLEVAAVGGGQRSWCCMDSL